MKETIMVGWAQEGIHVILFCGMGIQWTWQSIFLLMKLKLLFMLED